MKLIVGLGNPGKRYARTRHNVGFMVLDALHDELAKTCDMNDWSLTSKFNAEICGCTIHGSEKILLVKPTTFMNRSGEAVQMIAHFYKVPPKDLIVVHDEKDLPLGDIRIQGSRGHAGHNGIKSIINHIGTKDFTRVRVGIASSNPKKMNDTATFVLKKFGLTERGTLKKIIDESVFHILEVLS